MDTLTKISIEHKEHFEQARRYVEEQMTNSGSNLNIHNWEYVECDLDLAEKFINKEALGEEDAYILRYIILFINYGYIYDYAAPHKASSTKAKEYLNRVGYPSLFVNEVSDGIEAISKDNIDIQNKVLTIAYDIHHSYLGNKSCNKFLKNWWIESNINQNDKLGRYEWLKSKYNEFRDFEFTTDYAQKKLESRRKVNISKIKRKLLDLREDASLTNNKGALTMFKTALRNQVDMVNVADKKAAIMININAIILTLLLPLMASYIIDISRYILPTITLAITCGVTIIFATLATKPSKQKGELEDEIIKSGSRSLFFFGNFHEMERSDYNRAVRGLIARKNVMESTIINHLFDLGRILGHKYKLLRYTYTAFAIGIAITLISFAIMIAIPYDF